MCLKQLDLYNKVRLQLNMFANTIVRFNLTWRRVLGDKGLTAGRLRVSPSLTN